MEVFIAVSCNTTEHMVVLGSNPPHKESLFLRDSIDRQILHTDKNENMVDSR
uniref:Uncharacterized protein n=1 Tax=Rhizophora mucronata TaxID=61149 RepID=A0A2P2PR10_RHIMU